MMGPVTTSDAFEASAGLGDGAGDATGAAADAGAVEAAFVVDGATARSSLQPATTANTMAKKTINKLRGLRMLTNPSNPKSLR
jgi:hypothetical protein